MELKEFLVAEGKKINISISETQAELFLKYMELLLEWNSKINLTAITEPKDIVIKHFIDSLSVMPFLKDSSKIIDIGTGAGFPGIPIKIINPSLEITLVDATNKRVNFLKEVTENLQLEKIFCLHGRAEELGQNKDYRESFDYCLSRAVANLNTLSELCIPLVKVGGEFISLKGPSAKEEVKSSKDAVLKLGGEAAKLSEVFISNDLTRNLVIIKKIKSTPKIYPRAMTKISKNPL